MSTVHIEVSADLADAAQLSSANPSRDAARLLALELFREQKVSVGRAAELCQMPLEAFMVFLGERGVDLHYGMAELEQDRRTIEKLGL